MTPPKKQKNDLIFHAGVDPRWQVARTEALKGDVQGDGQGCLGLLDVR